MSLGSQVIGSFPLLFYSSLFFILYSICSAEETYIFGLLRLMPSSSPFLSLGHKKFDTFFVRKYLQNCFPENKSSFPFKSRKRERLSSWLWCEQIFVYQSYLAFPFQASTTPQQHIDGRITTTTTTTSIHQFNYIRDKVNVSTFFRLT